MTPHPRKIPTGRGQTDTPHVRLGNSRVEAMAPQVRPLEAVRLSEGSTGHRGVQQSHAPHRSTEHAQQRVNPRCPHSSPVAYESLDGLEAGGWPLQGDT
jgi:hypothetical protein